MPLIAGIAIYQQRSPERRLETVNCELPDRKGRLEHIAKSLVPGFKTLSKSLIAHR